MARAGYLRKYPGISTALPQRETKGHRLKHCYSDGFRTV